MRILALIVFGLLQTLTVAAKDIYANPENLRVFPADISPQALRLAMKQFSIATGLRCSNCHEGDEGQPLSEFDFASDAKTLKGKARSMMALVEAINGRLHADINAEHVEVACETCHRGIRKPEMLGVVLARAAESNGSAGIKEKYGHLRDRYYGTHSYDFSDLTLVEFAKSRLQLGRVDEAFTVLDLLLNDDPDSFQGHLAYAELARTQGNIAQAKKHYEKALVINPDAATFLQKRMETLRTTASPESEDS